MDKYLKRLKLEKLEVFLKNPFFLTFLFLFLYVLFFSAFFYKDYYPWGSDASLKHWPAREFLYTSLVKEHNFPFWTEKAYGGFPIYADLELGYLNPVNILSILIFGPFWSYKVLHLATFLISSWSLYAFLKSKNIHLIGILTGVVVFLYTFFTVNHQIHFNIILSFPLIPLSLLMVDKYASKSQRKYVIYQILVFVYMVLWGHLQTVFLAGLTVFTYSMFIFNRKKDWKKIVIYWATLILFTVLLTLPQLIPTFKLYQDSSREEMTDYREGSFNTVMFSNFVIPLQYGDFEDFDGLDAFSEGYSYTEIYIYVGITAFIFGFFSFMFSKSKFTLFAYSLVVICLVLVSVRFIPFTQYIPIINMFRHWNRAVILGSLGLALLIADLFSVEKIVFNRKRLFVLGATGIPFLLQTIYQYLRRDYYLTQAMANFEITRVTHLVWFVLIIISVIILVAYFYTKKTQLLSTIFFLILADMLFYVKDPLSVRIQKVDNPSSAVYVEGTTGKMVVDYYHDLRGYQYLNANYNSPFGYSQLANDEYKESVEKYGMDKHMMAPPIFSKLNRDFVEKLKIDYIIMEDGSVQVAKKIVPKF